MLIFIQLGTGLDQPRTDQPEMCKPKLVIDYNFGMQGVDHQDQVLIPHHQEALLQGFPQNIFLLV